jgi:hypothetical protein
MSLSWPEYIDVKIKNWAKYNPRTGKASTWFRMEHGLFGTQETRDFTPADFAAWLYLLSITSQSRGSTPGSHPDHTRIIPGACTIIRGLRPDHLMSAFKKFERNGWVEILKIEKTLEAERPTNVRTDVTDERTVTKKVSVKKPLDDAITSSPISTVRTAFLRSYKAEFNHDYPGWGAKENSQAKHWLKSVSLEKALELCWVYPKWNDPWVTKVGHPFDVLVKQYVQCEAWARNSKYLIRKIAAGKSIENVDIKRAVEHEELKRGLQAKLADRENTNASGTLQRQLPSSSPPRISAVDGDPLRDEIPDLGSKTNARASGDYS